MTANVDSAASFITAASESVIRRSVEAYRRGHTAAWRAFFHDLAYDVGAGHQTVAVGHYTVRRLTTDCAEPTVVFDRLVEAVRDLTAYTASREAEGDWLVEHNVKPSDENRETYLGVIEELIEAALDELLVGVCA